MLILLFFYDVFWVFATPVMVSVASNIQAPVLFLFPQTIFGSHEKKSLLGLGDIIVPGIFIAQTLIFSQKCAKRGNVYFTVALVAYTLALVTTMAVMQIFKHGQPALLYIVPYLLVSFSITVVVKGDVSVAWGFDAADFTDKEAIKDHKEGEELGFAESLMEMLREMFGMSSAVEKKTTSVKKKTEDMVSAAVKATEKLKKD